MSTVGDKIKLLRKEIGMSQTDLAEKINVSKQTLYKYENNIVCNIPADKIEAIAVIVNVSPSYLLGWEKKVEEPSAELREILNILDRNNELFCGKVLEYCQFLESKSG